MPTKQKTPARARARARSAAADAPTALPTLAAIADALYRSATESCRQHRRVACLVEIDAAAAEQGAAAQLADLADRVLEAAAAEYERAASELPHRDEDAWWHPANMLWLAAREWLRHQVVGDDMSGQMRDHCAERFGDLAMEYELEASALLGMHQAAEAYRRARPDAELRLRPVNRAASPGS